MAYLKPVKKKYKNHITTHYYSIVWIDDTKHKSISLKTTNYDDAKYRHGIVEDFEQDIKNGNPVDWFWITENSYGRTRLKKLTLNDIINKFIKVHKIGKRPGTIERMQYSFKSLMDVVKPNSLFKTFTIKDINKWRNVQIENKRANGGINVDLRNFKTLLIWCRDNDYINKIPKIKMEKTDTTIKYINEYNWNQIMQSDISQFHKDTFRLLRDIGVRRSDAVLGRIEGKFLVVDAEHEKTGLYKRILLTQEQIQLVQQLHQVRDNKLANGMSIRNFMNSLTKAFQKCCKQIGIYEKGKTTLHCLRHTYAVRRLVMGDSIYIICQKLYHKSVVQTERYAKININILEEDFKNLNLKTLNKVKTEVLETKNLETKSYFSGSSSLIN